MVPRSKVRRTTHTKRPHENRKHGIKIQRQDNDSCACGLPKKVQKYVLRHHWPSSRVTKQMLREDCYLVPEAASVGLEAGWRYSFCDSERVLCNHLSQKQRTCFRVLKALIQRNISDENSPPHYLKVALFWTCCDEVKSGETKDAGTFIFMLLTKYISFLESGVLPCFFVPECNLIGHVPDERRARWLKNLKSYKRIF